MENKKISELTSATLPLAGTEEVAIVQGGETKKVAASDLSGGGGTKQNFSFVKSSFMCSAKGSGVWVKQVSLSDIDFYLNETTSQTDINLLTPSRSSWVYQVHVDCYVKDIRFYTNGATDAMLGIIKSNNIFGDVEIIKNIQPADLISGDYLAEDIAEDVLLSAGDFIHIFGGRTIYGTSNYFGRISIIFKPV